jgi:hypothetical protein
VILHRFSLEDSKLASTPTDSHNPLVAALPDELAIAVPYKEAIGSLLYAALLTRPDIAYAVSAATKHCEHPTNIHWTMVKRIFRYLRGTRDYGILYFASSGLSLQEYCDSDFTADHDDRKSHSNYVFTLAGGPIAWTSQR